MFESYAPPGWPRAVPPPGVDGWQAGAVSWLLDHCPSEFRAYTGWHRHPLMLAWLAERHIQAQVGVLRQAWRDVRADVGPHVPPEALPGLMASLEAEGLRLRAASRAAALVHEALRGRRFVPRL